MGTRRPMAANRCGTTWPGWSRRSSGGCVPANYSRIYCYGPLADHDEALGTHSSNTFIGGGFAPSRYWDCCRLQNYGGPAYYRCSCRIFDTVKIGSILHLHRTIRNLAYVRRMRRRGWSPERIAGCWQLLGKGCISQRGDQSVDLRAGYGLQHIRRCKIYRNIADAI